MVIRPLELIRKAPKYGNDDDEADAMARRVSYAYTKPLEQYKNPRGGIYQEDSIPYLQMSRSADRPEQHRMADLPTHRWQTVSARCRAEISRDRLLLPTLWQRSITVSHPTEHCRMHRCIRKTIRHSLSAWQVTVHCLQHCPSRCRMILSREQNRVDFNQ